MIRSSFMAIPHMWPSFVVILSYHKGGSLLCVFKEVFHYFFYIFTEENFRFQCFLLYFFHTYMHSTLRDSDTHTHTHSIWALLVQTFICKMMSSGPSGPMSLKVKINISKCKIWYTDVFAFLEITQWIYKLKCNP